MKHSEHALIRRGVTFALVDGRDTRPRSAEGTPPDVVAELSADLRAAVAERYDAVRARMAGGPPMDGGKRWGACDTCGAARPSHRGGTCGLCHAAYCRIRDGKA